MSKPDRYIQQCRPHKSVCGSLRVWWWRSWPKHRLETYFGSIDRSIDQSITPREGHFFCLAGSNIHCCPTIVHIYLSIYIGSGDSLCRIDRPGSTSKQKIGDATTRTDYVCCPLSNTRTYRLGLLRPHPKTRQDKDEDRRRSPCLLGRLPRHHRRRPAGPRRGEWACVHVEEYMLIDQPGQQCPEANVD